MKFNCFRPHFDFLTGRNGMNIWIEMNFNWTNWLVVRFSVLNYGFWFRLELYDPSRDMHVVASGCSKKGPTLSGKCVCEYCVQGIG